MADQSQTETAETESTEAKVETVTAEQFQDLQAKLEAITSAQSGSDRKVAELTSALTAANEAKASTKKTAEDRIAELEQKTQQSEAKVLRAQLKTVARGILDEAELKPPAYFDRLIGDNEEETKALIGTYIEDERQKTIARNKQFDADHGRILEEPNREVPTSYEKVLEMSEEQLKGLGKDAIAQVIKDSMKKKE